MEIKLQCTMKDKCSTAYICHHAVKHKQDSTLCPYVGRYGSIICSKAECKPVEVKEE